MNPRINLRCHVACDPADQRRRTRKAVLALCGGLFLMSLLSGVCISDERSHPESEAGASAGGPTAQTLLQNLNHASALRRREALLRLADAKLAPKELLPRIWPLLQDQDPIVRAQAARAVCVVGGRSDVAVAVLIPLLSPQQPQSCALASFLLGEIGPAARDALPALQARMTEADALLRLHAAEAIVNIDPADPAAYAALLHALNDPSGDVRYFAACALLATGAEYRETVRGALLSSLADDDLRVATASALSLESCRSAEPAPRRFEAGREPASASPDLSRALSALSDANAGVRRQAAVRLAELGDSAAPAGRALREALSDPEPLVRAYAAWALFSIERDDPIVVPTLIDLLGTTRPNVTTLATSVLAEIGPGAADALPALYDVLETGDPLVRLHVASAISRIDPRGREAVGILTSAAGERDSDLRYLAALSLGRVSPLSRKRAERVLTGLLTDRNLRVRSAAARALETLRSAARSAVARAAAQPTGAIVQPEVDLAVEDDLSLSPEMIPVLDEEPAPSEASPLALQPGRAGEYDIDEDTIEERKSIADLRAVITPEEGEMPVDHFAQRFADTPEYYHAYGTARGWYGQSYTWHNTCLCYNPLYCQDLNLERYGYHYGCCQTIVSCIKFGVDAALLPYAVVAQSPCDCVYTLGYDRPGNCVPYRCYRLPWRTDAALILGGVAAGLVFLAP